MILNFAIYLALAVRFAVRSATTARRRSAPWPSTAHSCSDSLLPRSRFRLGSSRASSRSGEHGAPVFLAVPSTSVGVRGCCASRRRPRGLLVRRVPGRRVGVRHVGACRSPSSACSWERLWVLEGAGLVWVGVRQRKGWMKVSGIGLQAVAASVLLGEGVVSPDDAFTAETLTGWIVTVGLDALGLRVAAMQPRRVEPSAVLEVADPSGDAAQTPLDLEAEPGPLLRPRDVDAQVARHPRMGAPGQPGAARLRAVLVDADGRRPTSSTFSGRLRSRTSGAMLVGGGGVGRAVHAGAWKARPQVARSPCRCVR